ncbi:MAG: hypothetical protein ACOYEP_01960 [Limnochordia bacterium]
MPESFTFQADTSESLPEQVGDTVRLAGLGPERVTPALCRALMQWLEVLPQPVVADALRRSHDSPHLLETFRKRAAEALRHQPIPQPPRSTPLVRDEQELYDVLSESDRQALRRQTLLECLTDAEYQEELIRRFRHARDG